MQGARNAGLNLPGDLSIIGFDDNPLSSYIIRVSARFGNRPIVWGPRPWRRCWGRIEDPAAAPVYRMMEIELIERSSTAAPKPAAGVNIQGGVRPGNEASEPTILPYQEAEMKKTIFALVLLVVLSIAGMASAGTWPYVTIVRRNGPIGPASSKQLRRPWASRCARQQELGSNLVPVDRRKRQSRGRCGLLWRFLWYKSQGRRRGCRVQTRTLDDIPAGLKDADGYWFTIHYGTLGFFVNVDALEGKPVPTSWADLLKPEYSGMVGYLDPTSAFVGYAGATAANLALGGTLDDWTPGIEFLKN